MKKYDVFISYAIEDKESVAIPLTAELRQKGLNVYLVSDELSAGESLTNAVHEGLEQSAYYVLILSPDYTRRWTIIESGNALRREKKSRRTLIFPVWHRIGMHEVELKFPQLIDHYAETTADGIPGVAANLYEGIRLQQRIHTRRKWTRGILVALAALLVFFAGRQIFSAKSPVLPSEQDLQQLIMARISTQEQIIGNSFMEQQMEAEIIPLDSVKKIYNRLSARSTSSRNDFYFTNGVENISGFDNIQGVGLVLARSPHGAYGLSSPEIWCLNSKATDSSFRLFVVFRDTVATGFHVDSMFMSEQDTTVHAWVSYNHFIRVVYYNLLYSFPDEKIKQHVRLEGFKPREKYIVDNRTGLWEVREVE